MRAMRRGQRLDGDTRMMRRAINISGDVFVLVGDQVLSGTRINLTLGHG